MNRWRAALLLGGAALAWAAWDTGADPVRFLRGTPWMLDFVRRSLPPDLAVLRPALRGAFATLEIAFLGTASAAALAVPLGFLAARNVSRPAVFYPVRIVLNYLRSIDTLTDDDLARPVSDFDPDSDECNPLHSTIVCNTFGHYDEHRPWIEDIAQ